MNRLNPRAPRIMTSPNDTRMPVGRRLVVACALATALAAQAANDGAETTGTPVMPAQASMPAVSAQSAAPAPKSTVIEEPITVMAGTSRLIAMDERIETVVVAQPGVADAKPISAKDVVIVGKAIGQTDIVVRLESGDSVTRRVRVELDKAVIEERLARVFGVRLQVDDIGGTVALRGSLPNVATAALVHKFMDSTGMKWTDLTRIDGLQQVQLRVRIAEASRSALRELAFGGVMGGTDAFGGVQSPGGTPFQPVSIAPVNASTVSTANSTTQTANTVGPGQPNFGFAGNPVSSATTLFLGVPGADLEIFMRALTENRYVRLLAEPNLVAISGEKASFLVGGQFPVPVVQGTTVGGGSSTVTIEYKEFGVRLTFRPEVLGEGRIRLEVAPEVSELSEVGALVQNGFTVPSVTVRRSSSTVELGNGQSFALAGLLRSKDQGKVAKVPLLGDLPWWVTIVILAREVAVTVLRFVVIRHGVIPASRGGKVKTVAQVIAIALYLAPLGTWADPARIVTMGIALVLTIATGIDYAVRAWRLTRATS